MNFLSEIFSWAEGSRKAQATALGIFFILFYKVPNELGLQYEVSERQMWGVVGLLSVFVLSRMGHDMAIEKHKKEQPPT